MGQLDYSAELANIRAAKPDSVFFPARRHGHQLHQASTANYGLAKDVPLFMPGFSADEDTIKPVGAALMGTINSSFWGHEIDNPANSRFVADFEKEYGRLTTLFAAQGYDTGMLIDGAVRVI